MKFLKRTIVALVLLGLSGMAWAAVPNDLAGSAQAGSINRLTWTAGASPNIVGYKVYCATNAKILEANKLSAFVLADAAQSVGTITYNHDLTSFAGVRNGLANYYYAVAAYSNAVGGGAWMAITNKGGNWGCWAQIWSVPWGGTLTLTTAGNTHLNMYMINLNPAATILGTDIRVTVNSNNGFAGQSFSLQNIASLPVGRWTNIVIPLSSYGYTAAQLNNINGVMFQVSSKTPAITFGVDNIRFTGGTTTIMNDTFAANTYQASGGTGTYTKFGVNATGGYDGVPAGEKEIVDNQNNTAAVQNTVSVAATRPITLTVNNSSVGTNKLSWTKVGNSTTGKYKVYGAATGPITDVGTATLMASNVAYNTVAFNHVLSDYPFSASVTPTSYYYAVTCSTGVLGVAGGPYQQSVWANIDNSNGWTAIQLGGSPIAIDMTANGNTTFNIWLRQESGDANGIFLLFMDSTDTYVSLPITNINGFRWSSSWQKLSFPYTKYAGINFGAIKNVWLQANAATPVITATIGFDEVHFTGGTTPYLWYGDGKPLTFWGGAAVIKSEPATGGAQAMGSYKEFTLITGENATASGSLNNMIAPSPASAFSLTSPAAGATVTNTNVSFSWSSAGGASIRYKVTVDGTTGAWQVGTTYSAVLASGSHTWSVIATNTAGVVAKTASTPSSATFTIRLPEKFNKVVEVKAIMPVGLNPSDSNPIEFRFSSGKATATSPVPSRKLVVFDLLGRKVAEKEFPNGAPVLWTGKSGEDDGVDVSSEVYLYYIEETFGKKTYRSDIQRLLIKRVSEE